jgi:dihydrofolate reductase
MRKLIVSAEISLDGVLDDPQDFIFDYIDDKLGAYQNDLLNGADALIMGRITYEGLASYWMEHGDDEFGAKMNSLPKYVASHTLQEPLTWNATLLKDVAADVFALRQQPGHFILQYGMGELSYFLLRHGLVDEIRLLVYPVVIGKGTRIFADSDRATLTLLDSKSFAKGVVALNYQVNRQA